MMKLNKQEPQKVGVFDYSRDKLILIYFFIFFASETLAMLSRHLVSLGLSYGTVTQTASLGFLAKVFFIYTLTPSLIGINILLKNSKLPNLELHKVSKVCITFFSLGITVFIAVNGPASRVHFVGYVNQSVAILIYCSVAFYLLHFFRHEDFPKTLLIVSLAVLTVGELWELPYNISYLGGCDVSVFIVMRLHRYVPLFLWFFVFRKVYVKFCRERWCLAVGLLAVIAGLTAWGVLNPYGFHPFYLNPALRLSYALLLVFLPFQHSLSGEML